VVANYTSDRIQAAHFPLQFVQATYVTQHPYCTGGKWGDHCSHSYPGLCKDQSRKSSDHLYKNPSWNS